MPKKADTKQLEEINRRMSAGAMRPQMMALVDPDGKHVLNDLMLIDDGRRIRCSLLMKSTSDSTPWTIFPYDVPIELYNALSHPNDDDSGRRA